MKHKTFFWFFLPTASAMLLFIALPIFSIVIQSLFTPHDAVIIVTENCDPFGCKQETTIDQEATRDLRKSEPLGKFVGLEIYKDRGHLAVNEIKEIWVESNNFTEFKNNNPAKNLNNFVIILQNLEIILGTYLFIELWLLP